MGSFAALTALPNKLFDWFSPTLTPPKVPPEATANYFVPFSPNRFFDSEVLAFSSAGFEPLALNWNVGFDAAVYVVSTVGPLLKAPTSLNCAGFYS